MASNFISTIYSTLYFVLSAAMFVVLIPQKEEYIDYKKGRRSMGCAFMITGLLGLYRSIVTVQPQNGFLTFCTINLICLIFITLNYLGFLYISETSNARIRKTFRISCICALVSIIFCLIGFIFNNLRFPIEIITNFILGGLSLYLFIISLIEYDKVSEKLDLYYSNRKWDISWMRVLLWASFILGLLTLISFWVRDLRVYVGFISMLFHTYMTFKVLSFVPATIDRVRHESSLAETEEEEERIERLNTPSSKTLSEYSKKIEPMLNSWVKSEHFTRPTITIREAAAEMGTNHNYLSTYLNKVKGTSFTTWINTLRIEKSKIYLESEEKLSIEECGIKVGIPESYNFSRWFKLVTGMSPIAYRKTLRLK